MLTQEKINKFYDDVKTLGLKRPIAVIAEKTGYSKGNVSSYLSRKLQPSENFINAFYESFKIIPRATTSDVESNQKEKQPNTLAEALEIIKQQNAFLQRLVESNLAALATDVHNNAAAIRAEIRGYAQRQIWKEVNYNDEEFLKAKAEADKIYLLNMKQLLGHNNDGART